MSREDITLSDRDLQALNVIRVLQELKKNKNIHRKEMGGIEKRSTWHVEG